MTTVRPNHCESYGTQFRCRCEKLGHSTGSTPGRGRNRTRPKAEYDKFCLPYLRTEKLSSLVRKFLVILLSVMILGQA